VQQCRLLSKLGHILFVQLTAQRYSQHQLRHLPALQPAASRLCATGRHSSCLLSTCHDSTSWSTWAMSWETLCKLRCFVHLYISSNIGWSDVTESMATIRSPFCGYIMSYCVEFSGEDFSCYLNSIQSVGFTKMSVWSLACQQSVFQRYHTENHLSEFYPQDGGESQLASKLRHCRPMYCLIQQDACAINV